MLRWRNICWDIIPCCNAGIDSGRLLDSLGNHACYGYGSRSRKHVSLECKGDKHDWSADKGNKSVRCRICGLSFSVITE